MPTRTRRANTEQLKSITDVKSQLSVKLVDTTEKYTDIYTQLQTASVARDLLEKQLQDQKATNNSLEQNLSMALRRAKPDTGTSSTRTQQESESSDADARVVILHDSLCKEINNTILSREDVTTKKVWAPDLEAMLSAIETLEKTEVIVIQALTRDLLSKSVDEIGVRLGEVVDKALQKSTKVVISLLLRRTDSKKAGLKAGLVNAAIL